MKSEVGFVCLSQSVACVYSFEQLELVTVGSDLCCLESCCSTSCSDGCSELGHRSAYAEQS